MGFISDLFGIDKPSVSTSAAEEEVTTSKKKAALAKKALIFTEGGRAGEELEEGEVRGTLFGNR